MFAIFVIGMAILAILSGSFSYVLTVFDIVVISSLSFLIYYFVLGKRKVFLWVLLLSFLTAIGGSIYLYRTEKLMAAIEKFIDYLEPYYYSIKVKDYYIGEMHQFLLILFIGIFLYKVIVMFYRSTKFRFVPPIFGAVFIVGAFFAGSFSSQADRYAFLMFILASFIYYFEIYFVETKYSEGVRRRYSFYILGIVMGGLVFVIATTANNGFYNPFKERVKVVVMAPEERNSADDDFEIEQLELIYPVSNEYRVSSNFEHRGIQLFKVKTEKLKYYKGQTFNQYIDGKWTNTKTNEVSVDSVTEPVLKGDAILNEELFYNEEVEVIYQNVFTDSIITGPYTKKVIFEEEITDVNVYEDGMYKTDDMVGKNFAYTLSIAIPKYRTTALIEYLSSLDDDGFDLDSYLNVPDNYRDLTKLAESITSEFETDIEKAIAIERYLKTNLKYNEKPDFNPSEDMINEFLFETREGFCQQFATTMALMLRSVDIPSRFVTGYVMSSSEMDIDELPEELLYLDRRDFDPYKRIYDNNAHTWVEIYIPSFGWIQFEPTPGQNAVQFSDPVVFDYNPELNTKPSTFNTIVSHDYFVVGVVSFIIFIIGLFIFMFIRRGRRLKANIRRRLLITYRLILVYLKAVKLNKEGYETLREYSTRIDKRLTNVQKEFKDSVPMLENAFYNDEEPSIEDVELMESFLNEVKFSVRRMVVPITYRRLRFIEIILLHK